METLEMDDRTTDEITKLQVENRRLREEISDLHNFMYKHFENVRIHLDYTERFIKQALKKALRNDS